MTVAATATAAIRDLEQQLDRAQREGRTAFAEDVKVLLERERRSRAR